MWISMERQRQTGAFLLSCNCDNEIEFLNVENLLNAAAVSPSERT